MSYIVTFISVFELQPDKASVLEDTCTYLKSLQNDVNVCLLTTQSLYDIIVFPVS